MSAVGRTVPLVVLAGSDRRPVQLPMSGRGQHPLSGYKGVDLRIGDRPLLACVVDRMRACSHFDPIYVVGPAHIHRGIGLDAELIDADGSVGDNIRSALEAVEQQGVGRPIAFTSCDVLVEQRTLAAVMTSFFEVGPCDVFYPLIRVPAAREQLGASAWKPTYSVLPAPGEPVVQVLPGHLLIADPQALRLNFLYRLLNLAYSTRNRSLGHRRNVLTRGIAAELLYQDLRNLLSLRPPTLTFTVIATGVRVAVGLRDGTVTKEQLERAVRRVLVTASHRRHFPARAVHLPIIEGLSLARDIDTLEEARELGAQLDLGG